MRVLYIGYVGIPLTEVLCGGYARISMVEVLCGGYKYKSLLVELLYGRNSGIPADGGAVWWLYTNSLWWR